MKLYFKYLSIILKSQMQYKASFIMMSIGQFLIAFTTFIGIYFMLDRFNSVDSFSFSEILLCFSVVCMAFSAAECFARGFDAFPALIRSGMLDRLLLRPKNIIFQVLTANMDFSRLGKFLQSVLILCYAVPASGIIWTYDKIIAIALMLIGGTVIFTSLFMVYAGISFFTIDGLEFMNIFTDGGREFGKYPFSIYGEGVLKFFTYIIPLALFQYYPLLYLVGKSHDPWLIFLPLAGFLFMIPCYAFFKLGLKKYNSAGS